MSRLLLIASALSALTACRPAPQAMPARPPKPEAPAAGTGLLVTAAAVGPVTTTTPFDRNTIQRMFRESDVGLEFHQEGGRDVPVIMVRGPGDLEIAFKGYGGTVASAVITGSAMQGPPLRGFHWAADGN